MSKSTFDRVSEKYDPRFGRIAVDLGFITHAQLKAALCRQIDENLAGGKHRLLGTILFDMDLMSSEQIEEVLNVLFSGRGNPA